MRLVVVIVLSLTNAVAAAAPIAVNVDSTANVHPFSPLIFGVAFGDATRNAQIGYTVIRWGGNSTTRYNWQYDIHNTANDYLFREYSRQPGSHPRPAAGQRGRCIRYEAQSGGAEPLIAIPTIGLKPLDNSALQHPYTVGFSVAKYGAQKSVDPYDTNAGNGVHSNGTMITGNTASDTSDAAPPSYEAAWIAHLQATFGTAANGGVKFYSLDNEVMLWNSTHRDVHPNPPTYDEIWNKTVSYATAIKTQEPGALITGPVTWGYPDLFTSAADAASCNCFSDTDRASHGGTPFVAWYLQQVAAHPMAGGGPLVDYLDLHYYPQDPGGASGAIYSSAEDSATVGRRLRSLKELYDPNWTSESWIGTVDGAAGDDVPWHYTKPDLIPRVKAWINQYAPGTKLAITEYAWDNENDLHVDTISGGVAQAELFGIFAREGVDLATRWTAPAPNGFDERAFRLFLNYDGAGTKVQGDSVAATTADIDQIGAYAFHDSTRLMILLTNKDSAAHDVSITLNAPRNATWTLYGFDKTHDIRAITSNTINANTLTLTGLAAMSANLLVIPDIDEIFADGFQ